MKSPTPKLGILKGILIILFGFFLWNIFSFESLLINIVYREGRSSLMSSIIWASAIFGLCLWRGIVSIRNRRKNHISYLTIAFWFLLIILVCVWALHIIIG